MELNKTDRKLIDQIIAANSQSAKVHEYQAAEISEFNHLDLGFYKKKTIEASQSGFEWLFDIESPSIDNPNGTRTAIRLLAQKDRKAICALFHLKMNLLLRFIAYILRAGPLKVIEFETMFSDGTFVVTTTSKSQADIYEPPQITHHHVKEGSFENLYKLHQQYLNQHLTESSERTIVALESFDDIVNAQKTMDKYKMEHQQANHFLDQSQLPKVIRKDPDLLKEAIVYAKSQNPVVKYKQKNQLFDFEEQLARNELKFQETTVFPIENTSEFAYAVTTDIDNAEKDRLELQQLFQGKYYPVITELVFQGNDLAESIEKMGILSRYPFEAEMEFRMKEGTTKCDPESLISQSQSIDIDAAIEPFVAEHSQFEDDVLQEIRFELEEVERIIGAAPKLSSFKKLIENGKIKNQVDLQRILLSWILKNKQATAMELSKVDFNAASRVTNPNRYTPKIQAKYAIVLVPAQDMSEVPAYIHWEGSDQIGSATTCQLLKHWQERYHAQLVAVDANSMEFHLTKPIGNIKEAFDMAIIHNTLTPSMLGVSCNSIWYYALTLLRAKNWCLWSTP